MRVGQLIKMERQRNNMKQEDLAKGICSPSYLSKIESGSAIPGGDIQRLLLLRLNISYKKSYAGPSSDEFSHFSERNKKILNRRDKVNADLLCKDIRFFLEEHPLYQHRISLFIMETRLMLMTSSDLSIVKMNTSILIAMQDEMEHHQLFQLYLIKGILAYLENRFTNALQIFEDAYMLTSKFRIEDWEFAELHYILSLAALSDYRYISAIDHVQEALSYFNTKMLAKRSIECLLVLGIAKKHIGNADDALITFEKAKEITMNTEDYESLGMIEQNLGACHSLLKNSKRSLEHFNKSLDLKADPNEKIVTILSIVKEYSKLGNIENTKNWLNKGGALLKQLNAQNKSLNFYHFSVYKALIYNDKALVSIFDSALKYFESKQNYYQCFIYCNILAKELSKNSQFKLATTYYQKAFDYHIKHQKVQHWEELT